MSFVILNFLLCICIRMAFYSAVLPVSWSLGFFVSIVISRWASQLDGLPWPQAMATMVNWTISGNKERPRMIRRTLVRYIVLAYVITMVNICLPVKKRFPTLTHITEAGIMTAEEQKIMEECKEVKNKSEIASMWAIRIILQARHEGFINSDIAEWSLIEEINKFKKGIGILSKFDSVSIPLVYTQITTLVIYMNFACCLIGRQNIDSKARVMTYVGDSIFPIRTILEFLFFAGWFKVAEQLINPLGEDDDDFDINTLVDFNTSSTYLIVDDLYDAVPKLEKDQYWMIRDVKIPVAPNAKHRHYFGTGEKFHCSGTV